MRLLVTGFPRSGTTIVGRILTGLRQSHYLHEPFNTNFPTPGSGFRSPMSLYRIDRDSRAGQAELRQIQRLIEGKRGMSAIRRQDLRDPVGLGRRLFRSIGSEGWSDPASTLILKDPTAFYSADVLVDEYDFVPLVLVRDPVEVAGSFLARGWQPRFRPILSQDTVEEYLEEPLDSILGKLGRLVGDAQTVAAVSYLWSLGHRILVGNIASFLRGAVVRHDRLVEDPEGVLSGTLASIGLEMTPESHALIRDYCGNGEVSDQPAVPAVIDVRRDLNSVGKRAREVMSEGYRDLVREICHSTEVKVEGLQSIG